MSTPHRMRIKRYNAAAAPASVVRRRRPCSSTFINHARLFLIPSLGVFPQRIFAKDNGNDDDAEEEEEEDEEEDMDEEEEEEERDDKDWDGGQFPTSTQGRDLPSSIPSAGPDPNMTSSPSPIASHASLKSSNRDASAVVVGVIGGLIGILIVVGLVWVLRKSRHTNVNADDVEVFHPRPEEPDCVMTTYASASAVFPSNNTNANTSSSSSSSSAAAAAIEARAARAASPPPATPIHLVHYKNR
ncbi:hypothetical protein BX666DRAFT_2023696 [Dichotomocladium elegans]|nr:hypothetical protein BX666DRAFT_2023696 [Dichotomocladium elegans]